ncbi:MAG: hypothetical protein H6765_08445 [Candidatus Peribacteria bacterium]|nr:MAG: hypothetical protein H6765_08445 [Candidatus Peribacteria bacterium]
MSQQTFNLPRAMRQGPEHLESSSDLAAQLPDLLEAKNRKKQVQKELFAMQETVLGPRLEEGFLPHVSIDRAKLEQDIKLTPEEYLAQLEAA